MNVIGSRPDGWWKNRRAAMVRLVTQVERWALVEGNRVTVVFEKPMFPPIRSSVIDIAHAPLGGRNAADDEIVRLVGTDGSPGAITVATSDVGLADRVRRLGAVTYPAASFRTMVESGGG